MAGADSRYVPNAPPPSAASHVPGVLEPGVGPSSVGLPNTAPQGVIHDIGFRHYTGERLGRRWIVRSLLIETIRGVFGLGRPARAKVMPWILVGILSAPPLVIALSVLLTGGDDLPLSYTQYLTSMSLVISLFVAGAAPYCVSGDLRQGVMPLYFSRPMKRADYVAAKFAGLAAATFLALAVPETLLLVGALLAKLPPGDQFAGWAGGLVASAMLALLLAGFGLVVAAVATRRGLGMAAIITILLVASGLTQTFVAIADTRGNTRVADYLMALDPFTLVDGLAVRMFGVDSSSGTHSPPGALGAAVFALVAVAVVAACVGILARRYRKVGGA